MTSSDRDCKEDCETLLEQLPLPRGTENSSSENNEGKHSCLTGILKTSPLTKHGIYPEGHSLSGVQDK
jgi:hypothetical protein